MELSFFHLILLVSVCSANLQHFGNVQQALQNEREIAKIFLNIQKRENEATTEEGSNVEAVQQITLYKADGTSYSATVEEMCVFAHNYVRGKHNGTQDIVWNANLAAESETYAKVIAATGNMSHATGDFGENLYFAENSYNVVLTPANAVYSWYRESWDPAPKGGEIKAYDYNFEPENVAAFFAAGTGHFTGLIWKAVTSVGCGVAKTTYVKDTRTWTKTYIVARYLPEGNLLQSFRANVQPLINGESSLHGKITAIDLLPGEQGCKNLLLPSTCESWKQWGFCHIVGGECNCQCSTA